MRPWETAEDFAQKKRLERNFQRRRGEETTAVVDKLQVR